MNIVLYLVPFLVLIVAVVLHELAHGWTAEQLGDPTARRLGRITLNPIPHIDPVLTIAIPALLIFVGSPIIFGGAKPVPVNPMNLRHPRRDMVLVAVAGPVVNFILAGVSALLYVLLRGDVESAGGLLHAFVMLVLQLSILINLILALFNLLPVPPLDGGRIAVGLLPLNLARPLARLEPYGFFIVIGLLYLGVFGAILGPVLRWTGKLFVP